MEISYVRKYQVFCKALLCHSYQKIPDTICSVFCNFLEAIQITMGFSRLSSVLFRTLLLLFQLDLYTKLQYSFTFIDKSFLFCNVIDRIRWHCGSWFSNLQKCSGNTWVTREIWKRQLGRRHVIR